MKYHLAFVAAVLLLPFTAKAQDADDAPPSEPTPLRVPDLSAADENVIAAYCRYTEAIADSNRALAASPWLFGNAGTLPASRGAVPGEAVDATELGTPRLRVQAGVGLSPTRILRSASAQSLARLECRRYAVNAKMRRMLDLVMSDIDHVGPAPLLEKARVLREALTYGHNLNDSFRQRLEASVATLDDYRKLLMKLSELEQQLRITEDELARQPARVPYGESWAALRAESERVAAETARVDGSVRKSQAFEVVIRGGYDRIFGVEQRVPVFASATLRFSPGWFWQRSAESRAESAAAEWRSRQGEAALPAPRQFVQQLEARLTIARQRRADLTRAITELKRRLNDVKAVPGEQSRRFSELLWLDTATLRADEAFVTKQIEELTTRATEYRGMFR